MKVDDCVFFRLAKASQAATRFWGQRIQHLEVTPTQGLILNLLGEEDGVTSRQLGDRAVLDSATLTGILDRLEGAGLLARHPSPTDRRAVLIYLTASGRALTRQLRALMAAANAELLAALSAPEHDALLAQLRRVQDGATAAEARHGENEQGGA